MSIEGNLQVAEGFVNAFKARDPDRIAGLYTESTTLSAPGLQEPLKGPTAILELQKAFLNAFPDVRYENERLFGQGDWVCAENVFTGTHTKPLMTPDGQTIPATNKVARIPDCLMLKIEGGKITEWHLYFDQLGMLAQLGLAP